MTTPRASQRFTLQRPFLTAVALLSLFATALSLAAQPAASARPQRLVAGGDPTADPHASSGHGWVFLPSGSSTAADTGSGHLLHLVPRQGVQRASSGSVRPITPLTKAPLAIAGWQGTAILLQGPANDDATAPAERSVSTLSAEGPITPGTWEYRPPDHLKLRAGLPGDTVPRSMAGVSIRGTSCGPAVVWERVGPTSGTLEIAVLDDGGSWVLLEPPPGFPAPSGDAHVLASPSGVVLGVRNGGEAALKLWRADADITPPASPKLKRSVLPMPVRWVSMGEAVLPAPVQGGPLRTIGPAAPNWLWRDDGQTLLGHREGDVFTLWRLDRAAAVSLWKSPPLSAATGALLMGGLDAATVLTYDEPGAAQPRAGLAAPEPSRLRVIDVSHLTGAVIADLSAHSDGLLTRRDFQILWLLFILIGAIILMVVLRTDGPQEVLLPEGVSLATPARRVVAGAIDVGLAVGAASFLFGGSPSHWLAPATSTSSSLVPLLSIFGFGCLLSTLGEATVGCSPGKMLVGARVLGLVPASAPVGNTAPTIFSAARPRFHQAFLRNAVRWFMPPLGMLMLLDNNWRHPGDMLARTVVVVRSDPNAEPPPSPDDDDP